VRPTAAQPTEKSPPGAGLNLIAVLLIVLVAQGAGRWLLPGLP